GIRDFHVTGVQTCALPIFEGWGLLLQGPDNRTIKYFADQIVLANDEDGNQANTCILLSVDGVYGCLRTAVYGDWVIDFARGMIADRKSTRLNSSHVKISYA